ncbi:protein MMS22-like [Anopheles maculipalpis]|uniref:protein MMS22-like n=1 Tax=Anopheles maculipalpis TaxID=1496333 RepID=UPI0021599251|nr:protein MMS22-like [Anopheles maculipalpis]
MLNSQVKHWHTVFDCRSSDYGSSNSDSLLIFAQDGGQSFGLPFEMDKTTTILGIEVHQLYEQLVYSLSKTARERIQKLQFSDRQTTNHIRVQRLEITRFLRLVLGNASCMEGQVISESIALVLGALPDLVEPLKKNGWNSVCDKEICGYQIYHGVLEWRWLLMLILKDVKDCTVTANDEFLVGLFENRPLKTFGRLYGGMMTDMLSLAYHLFRMYGAENIIAKTPYTCYCTKLMWLGMMVLAEATKERLDFWICFNESMPSAVKESSDGYLFKIWIMNALSKFFVHKPTLEGEKPSATLLSGNIVMDDIVKNFLKSNVKEVQVREFLILLNPIITTLWPERFEIVIAVWDYFSVRLDSCFIAQNDSLEAMSCVSQSVAGYIEQASLLAASETTPVNLNLQQKSFHLFLVMLSKVIRHCTTQALNRKVQIIFNRIFLKLGPKKFENITEQAIYNLGLMFLTMISATSFETDYPRLSKLIQMIPLICGPTNFPIEARIKRIVVAAQVHMALLVLFTGSSFDKTEHIVSFLQSIEIPYRKYGNRMQPVLKIIAEGMQLIYEKALLKKSFNRGEKHLIGSWILKYLRNRSSERKRQKLLEVILASLNCKDAPLDDEYFNAVDQYVMPFVKEKFSSKVSPSCIAQIAAHMTRQKLLSYTTLVHIPSFFTTYINCPTACPEQVLVYLKELSQSSKCLTLIGESIIIQQWLKLGFYFDRESLLDLTRAVYSLKEFRFLCEIAEYDLFESNAIPMKLFFLSIAKRYKESDTVTQIEMQNKLHNLFQNFDEWFSKPEGIIRRRILAVLVLALTKCPDVFYIPGNYSCLYSIAFQHFFLPCSVLAERDIQHEFVEEMARIFHNVMDIIGNMDYSGNETIEDTAYNMINKWLPHFAKLKNPNDALKPLIQFFCGRNEALVLYTMPRFVTMFVDLQRCLPKPNALPIMQLLKKLIETLVSRKNYAKIALFIRTMGLSITQHAFMCNAMHSTRAIAMEIVYDLLNSTEGSSDTVKQEMGSVLVSFTHKYFSVSAECYINFMCRLVDHKPNFIRSMIDLMRCDVSQGEITCGQQKDNILQKALECLENAFKENRQSIVKR